MSSPIATGPLAGLAHWAPGMLALPTFTDSGGVLVSCVDPLAIGGIVPHDPDPLTFGLHASASGMLLREWEPDLTDAATIGCLLQQVYSALGGFDEFDAWVREHGAGIIRSETIIAAFEAAGERG